MKTRADQARTGRERVVNDACELGQSVASTAARRRLRIIDARADLRRFSSTDLESRDTHIRKSDADETAMEFADKKT
jgi:hypothetical protein